MNILIIGGRLARQRWTAGGLAAEIVRGLAARGHGVRVACESVDDPGMFAPAEVAAYDKFSQSATDWPAGFAAWALRERRKVGHDVCLSLARTAAGDVWFPIEPSAGAWLARAWATRSATAMVPTLARHHGVLAARAAEAVRPWPKGGRIARIVGVGMASLENAADAIGGGPRPRGKRARLIERLVQAPFFSALDVPEPKRLHDLRARTRSLLGVGEDRMVVLVSATGSVGRCLDNLMAAAYATGAGVRRESPVVLALAKEGFRVHEAAVRTNFSPSVRVLGLTESVEAGLAACDVAAAAMPCFGGAFRAGATGRFAADALRMGKPVLALRGAPGAELVVPRRGESVAPGLIVEENSVARWQKALRDAAEEGWMARAGEAAARAGSGLGVDGLIARLERVLIEAAGERK